MSSSKEIKMVQEILSQNPVSKQDLLRAKKEAASVFKIPPPPHHVLLKAYHELVKKSTFPPNKTFEKLLQTRAVRSISGVSIITVLTKPFPCPGKCVYCPTEVRMPKSYIASEPAAARSLYYNFDPYKIVQGRLSILKRNGHPTDKIELIVKGGTWSAYPLWYQIWFLGRCFDACNQFGNKRVRACFGDTEAGPHDKDLWTRMEKAQTKNETAGHRIIGLTLETRPDSITPKEVLQLRRLGCTRMELGLQHTDDVILKLTKRGHTLAQFKTAARLLREAGFKVDFHTMPQQPGSTPAKDKKMYDQLYADPDLRPDMIKIYPCSVVPSAELYQWYKEGRYKPYSDEKLFEVLLYAKKLTPRYVRISRLIRDIPSTEIAAGNMKTNLREDLQSALAAKGETCHCLRCREVGRHPELATEPPVLYVDKYECSGGKEFFLSFEDATRRAVFAFLRLRVPAAHYEKKLPLAFIRELHTYGVLVPIGKQNTDANQHKGLGRRLMTEAERIAKENGITKMSVIAGVGVREYYKKLGYHKEDTYMVKEL